MKERVQVAMLGLLAMVGAGCRIDPRPAPQREVGSARQAVVGGALDSGDPAVVALIARRARCEGEDLTLLCTGTLVAPRVVLAAAHCLDVFGDAGQYEIFFGPALGAAGGRFSLVTAARRHPAYDPSTHEHDLALLRLAEPAPVDPMSLPAGPLSGLAAGQGVRAVGFGDSTAGSLPAGEKRDGQMVISEVTATAVRSAPGPALSCTGDSGGPVLAALDGGEQLAAVTASGDPGCNTYAFNVRVDAALDDFILPFLAETEAAPAGYGDSSSSSAELCTLGCAGPADCPSGLACEKDARGAGRCMLLSLREGSFAETCSADAQCSSGRCARLLPEGAGACRCFNPCPASPSGWGCSAAGAGALGGGLGLLGVLALLWRLRASARG